MAWFVHSLGVITSTSGQLLVSYSFEFADLHQAYGRFDEFGRALTSKKAIVSA